MGYFDFNFYFFIILLRYHGCYKHKQMRKVNSSDTRSAKVRGCKILFKDFEETLIINRAEHSPSGLPITPVQKKEKSYLLLRNE